MISTSRTAIARQSRTLLLAILCAGSLSACTDRVTARRAPPHPDAGIQPVYVATTRALDKTGPEFGAPRRTGLNTFRVDVSVPPTHRTGHIEWAVREPDAARDFVVTGTEVFPDVADMARRVQAGSPGKETLVFVHGYNNTLSQGMYRLAQIQYDFNRGTPAVLFSWPSAGDARGYVYDRDSVLFSRDDLESVLRALTRAPGEKVFLAAHSMGTHLTMEVLRQAALKGDRQLLDRISGVVLISPDIDPDLFRRQAAAIGGLPQPFYIFVARSDRALSLSSILTGHKPRLGVIDRPEKLAGLDVRIVDFSRLADGQGLDHFVPATSASAVSMIKGLMAQAQAQDGQSSFKDYLLLKPQTPAGI